MAEKPQPLIRRNNSNDNKPDLKVRKRVVPSKPTTNITSTGKSKLKKKALILKISKRILRCLQYENVKLIR